MSVKLPYLVYFDTVGKVLEDGYIYIGEVSKDPETYPLTVYWDIGLSREAEQPIRTVNGYPAYGGSPGKLFVAETSYSMTVKNRNKELVWSEPIAYSEQIETGDPFTSTTNGGEYPANPSAGFFRRVAEDFTLGATSGSHNVWIGDYILANKQNATAQDADWDIIRGKYQTILGADFDSSTNAGEYPAAGRKGETRRVTEDFVTGATSGSHALRIGDRIQANKNGAAALDADWDIILGKDSGQKVVDISSKNLRWGVTGNDTVDLDADAIDLINSSNQVKQITDVDLTYTKVAGADIQGTVPPHASHWYQGWVDEDENKILVPELTGTADGTSAGFLVWSGGTAFTDGVTAGDIVYNTKDLTKTTVSVTPTVDGDPIAVTDDIFVNLDTFQIHQLSPTVMGNYKANVGAVYNNAAGNFDDSYYTQIQEPKYYSEAAGDFTVTGTNWTTVSCEIRVKQVNDWLGRGYWNVEGNYDGTISVAANGLLQLSTSGLVFLSGVNPPVSVFGESSGYNMGYAASNSDDINTYIENNTATRRVSFNVRANKKPSFHT